jgi:hypothetical protein
MSTMNTLAIFHTVRRMSVLAALTALLGTAVTMAHAEQVQARVISSTPVTESNGSVSYDVTYEYAGRHYTTRRLSPPTDASIWIDANGYGVTSPATAPPPQAMATPFPPAASARPWEQVAPESGVVVSGGEPAAPAAVYVAPGYAQPAQIYYNYPAPVYYPAPLYYPAPAYYPPIGISFGFGFTRGGYSRGHSHGFVRGGGGGGRRR